MIEPSNKGLEFVVYIQNCATEPSPTALTASILSTTGRDTAIAVLSPRV